MPEIEVLDFGTRVLSELLSRMDLAAVAGGVTFTWALKRFFLVKPSQALPPGGKPGTVPGAFSTRMLPILPAVFAVFYLLVRSLVWKLLPAHEAVSTGVISGTVAVWLYNVKRVTIFGE